MNEESLNEAVELLLKQASLLAKLGTGPTVTPTNAASMLGSTYQPDQSSQPGMGAFALQVLGGDGLLGRAAGVYNAIGIPGQIKDIYGQAKQLLPSAGAMRGELPLQGTF